MKRFTAVLLAMLFSAGLPAIASADTTATVSCTERVIDSTADHVLDRERVSAAAIAAGNNTGADIYVRAFDTTPGGDAETWWREAYRACPAWLGPDRERPKPNVLVVMFSLDRQSAIKYGPNLHKLDSKVDAIRGRTLGNGLRTASQMSGDHRREGFTNAVTDTLAALDSAANYIATPVDWSGFWKWTKIVVLSALSAIAAAVASVSGSRVFRSWRDKKAKHAEAVRQYERASKRAAEAIFSADITGMRIEYETSVAAIDGEFEGEDFDLIKDEIGCLSEQYMNLPNKPPRDMPSIVEITGQLTALTNKIDAATDRAKEAAGRATERARKCTLKFKVADLRSAHHTVSEVIKSVDAGDHVWANANDYRALLHDHQQKLDSCVLSLHDGATVMRADVDTLIGSALSYADEARRVFSNAAILRIQIQSTLATAIRDTSTYSSPVRDVSEETRATTHTALKALLPMIQSVLHRIDSGEVSTGTVALEERRVAQAYAAATLPARQEIAVAEGERAEAARKKRKADEDARRAERLRREEEERRRRSSSASSFGAGSAFGSSYGGSFGGGSFGGGSSGSW